MSFHFYTSEEIKKQIITPTNTLKTHYAHPPNTYKKNRNNPLAELYSLSVQSYNYFRNKRGFKKRILLLLFSSITFPFRNPAG